jgi:uncharacterized membrane protein
MDPVDNLSHYKFGVFYFNINDVRTIVPKRNRPAGYSLNFASWKTYCFTFFVLSVLIVALIY